MERAGRNKACRILFVEPFYGGSHRQFADTLARISSHHIELVTLPARFWRWRRRLAAFEIDRRLRMAETLPEGYDLILVSDYVDIGDLRALWGNRRAMRRLPPIAWYCHETQSTYPLPKGRTVEADVVAADMRNALHADSIAFNSRFHQESFAALYADHTRLLGHWEPEWRVEPMEHKSRVIYPGVECPGDARTIPQDRTERQQGEGPSETETLSTTEAEQIASRGYKERYVKFRKQAEAVLESEPLPLGHRQTVKRYFESIRPESVE